MGRFYIKRKDERLFQWSISLWVIQSGAERVRVVEFAADVHGEFKFPTHGFNDAGGCDFDAVRVVEDDFDAGTFLKGCDFDVDVQSMAIGVWLGRKRADPGFFGNSAGEVVFGQEKVHLGIITIKEDVRLWSGLVLDYSFIR